MCLVTLVFLVHSKFLVLSCGLQLYETIEVINKCKQTLDTLYNQTMLWVCLVGTQPELRREWCSLLGSPKSLDDLLCSSSKGHAHIFLSCPYTRVSNFTQQHTLMPSCLLFLWACLQIIRCMVSTTHSPLHVVVKPQPLRLNNEVNFKMPKTSVPLMSTVLEDGSKSQYTLNLLLFKSLNRTLWLCWCLILLLIKLLVSSGKNGGIHCHVEP